MRGWGVLEAPLIVQVGCEALARPGVLGQKLPYGWCGEGEDEGSADLSWGAHVRSCKRRFGPWGCNPDAAPEGPGECPDEAVQIKSRRVIKTHEAGDSEMKVTGDVGKCSVLVRAEE